MSIGARVCLAGPSRDQFQRKPARILIVFLCLFSPFQIAFNCDRYWRFHLREQILFLTSLCSLHPDVVSRGLEGLGLLCEESSILLEFIDQTTDSVLFDYFDISYSISIHNTPNFIHVLLQWFLSVQLSPF